MCSDDPLTAEAVRKSQDLGKSSSMTPHVAGESVHIDTSGSVHLVAISAEALGIRI